MTQYIRIRYTQPDDQMSESNKSQVLYFTTNLMFPKGLHEVYPQLAARELKLSPQLKLFRLYCVSHVSESTIRKSVFTANRLDCPVFHVIVNIMCVKSPSMTLQVYKIKHSNLGADNLDEVSVGTDGCAYTDSTNISSVKPVALVMTAQNEKKVTAKTERLWRAKYRYNKAVFKQLGLRIFQGTILLAWILWR